MLAKLLKELGFMGYRTSTLCKVQVDSPENMNSMLVTINGLTRWSKLSKRELESLRSYLPRTIKLYLERRLFGICLWRIVV